MLEHLLWQPIRYSFIPSKQNLIRLITTKYQPIDLRLELVLLQIKGKGSVAELGIVYLMEILQ